jgi:hypothetical protein
MHTKSLFRSLALTALVLFIFLIPTPFLTADQQVELWSGGLTMACLWGVWRWGPTAWRAYREGSKEPWHYGIMAIVILLLFMIGRQFYQVLYIRLERPEDWHQMPISAFIIYGIMIAVWLFSIATKVDGEKPSKVIGWLAAIGAGITLLMSSLFPILLSKGAAISRVLNSIL